MILAVTWASPSIVWLLKSGGRAPLGPSPVPPPLKVSQPEQQHEAGHWTPLRKRTDLPLMC